ncbi:MAG: Photosystem I reaction center subunit III [Cyanophyceae cyanobacterium]
MRRLLALVTVFMLWFGLVSSAYAEPVNDVGLQRLVPCSESPAYQERAKNFRNTIGDPQSGQKRAERYAKQLCGPEGLPYLVVDGRPGSAGDFIVPSLIFLYIAGWIGWVGRSYIIDVRDDKNPEMKEIQIDVPLALTKMFSGFLWPVAAVQELLSGELTAKETEIPVSPR